MSGDLTDYLVVLPLWYLVFLLSTTCHEAAHAFAAYRGGDPTAYLGGQVSLNPIPHVVREPFGTVLVPLLSFVLMRGEWMIGWASAPYDPAWEARHPRRAAAMAAAGPLANLLLAGLAFAVLKVGLVNGAFVPGPAWPLDRIVEAAGGAAGLAGLGRFCSVLLALNVLLFLFNLIPMPPLDGASVLGGLIEPVRRALERLRSAPLGALIGLVIAWRIFPYVFRPVYRWVVLTLWG
jgi:Zn-dependent protease